MNQVDNGNDQSDTSDTNAENTVCETIDDLLASGSRACSHTVPEPAAERLAKLELISVPDAYVRIVAAVATLQSQGRIEAPAEPWKDWCNLT